MKPYREPGLSEYRSEIVDAIQSAKGNIKIILETISNQKYDLDDELKLLIQSMIASQNHIRKLLKQLTELDNKASLQE